MVASYAASTTQEDAVKEEKVAVADDVPPVIVSDDVKVPETELSVIEVEPSYAVVMTPVLPEVPPVTVSPATKVPLIPVTTIVPEVPPVTVSPTVNAPELTVMVIVLVVTNVDDLCKNHHLPPSKLTIPVAAVFR